MNKVSHTTTPPIVPTDLNIALVGNPNSGKSTLFNILTGLNQNTGNFPGVTVEKKRGASRILNDGNETVKVNFIDLPGIYSLYPRTLDEKVAFEVICDPTNADYPELIIIVADASNLKRSLFLASQILDLNIPTILALNMMDLTERKGQSINIQLLSEKLGVKVIPINARKNLGIEDLKKAVIEPFQPSKPFIKEIPSFTIDLGEKTKNIIGVKSHYAAIHIASNLNHISSSLLDKEKREELSSILQDANFIKSKFQTTETIHRYKQLDLILKECVTLNGPKKEDFTSKMDKVLTHKIGGYIVFLLVLSLLFQTIFALSNYPMQWIESFFISLSQYGRTTLPEGVFTDLLINGILAGLSGIFIFIPQIALLFAFIGILEDTGYMARVSFIMDRLMRKFGLHGKSIIPLISGVACAVPAIMSTRTIGNWKERIITIMVTPLMSCSARLPVYTLLIALVIPQDKSFLFFNLQGLTLMLLYLIGFLAALGAALVMKFIFLSKEKSFFIMELPIYRAPRWSSIGISVIDKVKIFLFDAGKIILAISVIIWVLSFYGPAPENNTSSTISKAQNLEQSYAGVLGKKIEPVIKPLGFDWKIGIALITSFAAREVFVGTMATIYSIEDDQNTHSIRRKMQDEKNPETGQKKYTAAVGISLMLFYAFAMQCMSTLAVVFRETKSWKWPIIQFIYMGVLAYLSSFFVYNLLN